MEPLGNDLYDVVYCKITIDTRAKEIMENHGEFYLMDFCFDFPVDKKN